jgi:hypothetical protein
LATAIGATLAVLVAAFLWSRWGSTRTSVGGDPVHPPAPERGSPPAGSIALPLEAAPLRESVPPAEAEAEPGTFVFRGRVLDETRSPLELFGVREML